MVPGWLDATAIFFIGTTSFVGQLLISHAFQLGPTFQVSILSYTQVRLCVFVDGLLINCAAAGLAGLHRPHHRKQTWPSDSRTCLKELSAGVVVLTAKMALPSITAAAYGSHV